MSSKPLVLGGLVGQWEGDLEAAPGVTMPLVFRHSMGADGSLESFLDSPAQKTVGIPVKAGVSSDGTATFTVAGVGHFAGKVVENGALHGEWSQAGASYPIELTRTSEVAVAPAGHSRPQYPEDPLPYPAHEVSFPGGAEGVTLAGTLTVPADEHVATVLLLAGSGPQARDQAVAGHHTFRVLSDHLTKRGIAVLRYDKRGVAESKGDYANATVLDFGKDATAAAEYLLANEQGLLPIPTAPFGIVGHSEGGLTGPLAVLDLSDRVDFLGLMGSMAMKGIDLQGRQNTAIALAAGLPAGFQELMESQLNRPIFEIIAEGWDAEDANEKIRDVTVSFVQNLPDAFSEMFPEEQVEPFLNGMKEINNPWFHHFFGYDPLPALRNVRELSPELAVLAINGAKDLQVLPENLEITSKVFEGHGSFTSRVFDSQNHLFQTCTTGLHTEYADIEESFSPVTMDFIADWIRQRKKRTA